MNDIVSLVVHGNLVNQPLVIEILPPGLQTKLYVKKIIYDIYDNEDNEADPILEEGIPTIIASNLIEQTYLDKNRSFINKLAPLSIFLLKGEPKDLHEISFSDMPGFPVSRTAETKLHFFFKCSESITIGKKKCKCHSSRTYL